MESTSVSVVLWCSPIVNVASACRKKKIDSWRPHMCLNSIQTVCIACPGSLYILIDDLCNPCGGEPGDEATVNIHVYMTSEQRQRYTPRTAFSFFKEKTCTCRS